MEPILINRIIRNSIYLRNKNINDEIQCNQLEYTSIRFYD